MKRLKWPGALGAAWVLSFIGVAQAGTVYWSVGVHQPGVYVGVSNSPPLVAPYTVVVHAPQPALVATPPHRVGWVPPGHRYASHKRHDKHHGQSRNQQVIHVVHHHHYHSALPARPNSR
jgi:hypothetical protein